MITPTGAGIAIQSLHKAGGGLCQASIILLGGHLVNPMDLRRRLDLITTTSPSALMYGSIDGWPRQLALHGQELIDGALARAARIRDRLARVPGLSVMDDSIHATEGVVDRLADAMEDLAAHPARRTLQPGGGGLPFEPGRRPA